MRLTDKFRPTRLVRRFVPGGPIAGHAVHGAGFGRAPLAEPLKRIGSLEVRLARNAREVRLAQALRYRVFYREMSAQAGATGKLWRRDIDGFDSICDHLLVIDHDPDPALFRGMRRKRKPAVVGTYRLLRQEVAEQFGGFYTAGEYEIDALVARHRPKRFLELGRSCVLKEYRNKRTVELLWAGNWAYVQHHEVDVMIGCASLEGIEPRRLSLPLSFLHHHAAAPEEWRIRAVPSRYVPMNRMAPDQIDMRAALNELPPLIKGYLRLGAYIGDGAVVDHQFGTTDVCIVLPVSAINPRYYGHFGAPKERLAS
ncbi:GNAT family N-acetyltransferase [Microbaculum marinisediminis]|uniref:L-ornithine N(alpha)-acyltransferase n=1 Tax=Microbaculum marinisediminis TaxID=2931392 RepID=A0AAW5QWQ8_9HYPH|nr:GNAT family N-acetyltransferase [Microbaculum sp. A6E488]MCT8972153.1 GNAT family N-acetyltransferase [Microbaculum sp. A6E488]